MLTDAVGNQPSNLPWTTHKSCKDANFSVCDQMLFQTYLEPILTEAVDNHSSNLPWIDKGVARKRDQMLCPRTSLLFVKFSWQL